MFGNSTQCHIWQKPHTVYWHKHLISTVKHGGGAVIQAYFATTGLGYPAAISAAKVSYTSYLIRCI